MDSTNRETSHPTGADAGEINKKSKINLIGGIIIIGFALSVFYHYFLGAYAGLGYPYNTFLFTPADRFNDFFNPYNQTTNLDPYYGGYFFPSNYYPFAHIVLYPFTLFKPASAFIMFSFIICLSITYITAKFLAIKPKTDYIRNIFTFSFLTYPVLFSFDRGNIESIVFILMYIFVYYAVKGKDYVGSVALSAAIAMKVFPAVFFALLFSMKKYKMIVFTALLAILLTVFSASLLHGGFSKNLSYFLDNIGGMNRSPMIQGNNLVQRGVSLYTLIKIILIETDSVYRINMDLLLKYYTWVMLALFLALSFFITRVNIKMWEKVFLLVAAILLFPHFSADYKLLHIYIPMALFIQETDRDKSDLFYSVLYGLLLIPKDYYYLNKVISDSGASDISISVVINIIIILIISSSIIIRSFYKKDFLIGKVKY